MSYIGDRQEKGIWVLRDERDLEPHLRAYLAGARLIEGEDWDAFTIAEQQGKGTAADIHPWTFWQGGNRKIGSWQNMFGAEIGGGGGGGGRFGIAGARRGGAPSSPYGAPGDTGPGMTRSSSDSGGRDTLSAQPIRRSDYKGDSRYVTWVEQQPTHLPLYPDGYRVVATSGTEETSQQNLLLPADGRIVCPQAWGPDRMGTTVCDLVEDSTLGRGGVYGVANRDAPIQTLNWVVRLPELGMLNTEIGNAVALNGTRTRQGGMAGFVPLVAMTKFGKGAATQNPGESDPPVVTGVRGKVESPTGDGGGASAGGAVDPGQRSDSGSSSDDGQTTAMPAGAMTSVAFMSNEASGPWSVGYKDDKHRLGETADGQPINSGHIHIDAYFEYDEEMDGPHEHTLAEYPEPPLKGYPWVTQLRWDKKMPHAWVGGTAMGKWRRVTWVPLMTGGGDPPPGDVPPEDDPPGDVPPTGDPEPPPFPEPTDPTPPIPTPTTPAGGTRPSGKPPSVTGAWSGGTAAGARLGQSGASYEDRLPGVNARGRAGGVLGASPGGASSASLSPGAGLESPGDGASLLGDSWVRVSPDGLVGEQTVQAPFLMGMFSQTSRAQSVTIGQPDFRYQSHSHEFAAARLAYQPAVMRTESWAEEPEPGVWTYTQHPAKSRAVGGTASGGTWHMPPEYDLVDYRAGAPRAITSSESLRGVTPGIWWAAGLPSQTGVSEGIRWGYDETDDELKFAEWDGSAWQDRLSIGEKVTAEGTGAQRVPVGTTAQRPGSPETGDTRFNTTDGVLEFYDGTTWVPAGGTKNVCLSTYLDRGEKFSEENIHGGLDQLLTGVSLNAGTSQAVDKGIGKLLFVVNAGTDVDGTIDLTGDQVDRDTGSVTSSGTESITVDALSTDATVPDANGNNIYDLTDCYISSHWYSKAVSIDTTDLNISDLDVYHISFEQFNDTDTTLTTLDISCQTNNLNAEGAWHLYTVIKTAGKVDVTSAADIVMDLTGMTNNVNLWRLRRGNLDVNLTGASDGVFLQQFLGPTNQRYFTDITTKVWGEQ